MTIQNIKINFQPSDASGATVPEGYTQDSGDQFDDDRGFGWVRADSLDSPQGPQPISIPDNVRRRQKQGIPPRLDTLIHLQHPKNGTPAVAWQCKLQPGEYIVTLSVGDPDVTDSEHQINVRSQPGAESKAVITKFQPETKEKFRTATEVVQVVAIEGQEYGLLTIDATGGKNTKLNYIIIEAASRPFIRKLTGQVIQNDEPLVFEICDGAMDVPCNVKLTPSLEISPELVKELQLSANNPGVDSSGQAANFLVESLAKPKPVETSFTTSGGGDTFTLTPEQPLRPNSQYRFQITSELKSAVRASGSPEFLAFLPKTIEFTTGKLEASPPKDSPVKFEQVALPKTTVPVIPGPFQNGETYTGIAIEPGNKKLYAGTLSGKILRFPILADGILGDAESLEVLPNRAILGMCFDPVATAKNPILWVSHNAQVDMRESKDRQDAPDWSGIVSCLSGPDFERVDYVTGLPRSVADHVTTGIAFNPREPRILYVLQGSNTAMGVPGGNWGDRPERLLSAALLRVDLGKVEAKGLPVHVQTEDLDGSKVPYDPSAADAPVTIYATGFRSPYAMVFHSNGKLYVTNNGSAKNYPVPDLPNGGAKNVKVPYDDRDSLFRVESGGYYGHPNPKRQEWIMNGGHPKDDQIKQLSEQFKQPQWQKELAETARKEWERTPEEREYPWIQGYPDGTNPESHWKGYAHNFGLHASPTGLIEYKSDRFAGELKGKLIAVCFNFDKNLAVLTPGNESDNWNIVKSALQVPGLTKLNQAGLLQGDNAADPLDLVENPTTGDLYVTKLRRFPKKDPQQPDKTVLNFGGEIVLLRPIDNRTNSQ